MDIKVGDIIEYYGRGVVYIYEIKPYYQKEEYDQVYFKILKSYLLSYPVGYKDWSTRQFIEHYSDFVHIE